MIDLQPFPGLVCGKTYRDPQAESKLPALREGEHTSFTGCGQPMALVHTYRCRQCARWMHGDCLDRHFGKD